MSTQNNTPAESAELQAAKFLFKIHGEYTREEVNQFFNLERTLLLQELADSTWPEHAEEAKRKLAKLEAAYNLLIKNLASSTPNGQSHVVKRSKNEANLNANSVLMVLILLIIIGGAIFHYLFNKSSFLKVEEQAITEESDHDSDREFNRDTFVNEEEVVSPYSQSSAMTEIEKTKQMADRLIERFRSIGASYQVSLPKLTRELYVTAGDYAEQGRYQMAHSAYVNFVGELKSDTEQLKSYLAVFKKYERLRREWEQLAQDNNFVFEDHEDHIQQFTRIQRELQDGDYPSYSSGLLDVVCFKYSKIIERGRALAQQKKDYMLLKKRWEKKILSSGYYNLTPSIESLINKADQTLYANEFEYLQTQVFPRLIKHFKQHLG